MENSSIRRQWLDSYQSHLLEEEHSPQTIRKYIHDIAFFFSFLPAEAEMLLCAKNEKSLHEK